MFLWRPKRDTERREATPQAAPSLAGSCRQNTWASAGAAQRVIRVPVNVIIVRGTQELLLLF